MVRSFVAYCSQAFHLEVEYWKRVFQMLSQISRILNLVRKFCAKRCGLYAGVYGICGCHLPILTIPLFYIKIFHWLAPCTCR